MAIGKPILEKSSQGQKRSTTQILTLSDPKIRGQGPKTLSKRAHNPLLKEAGLTNKADSRPPLRGPGGWGGDWYLWHAPDGLSVYNLLIGHLKSNGLILSLINPFLASAQNLAVPQR